MGSPTAGQRRDDDGAMMAAIEAVYVDRFAQFHRLAAGITGDQELGRDAVQEAFARAIRRRRDYRGDGPLEGWLWRTLINVARDQCRAGKGVVACAEPPEPADHLRPGPAEAPDTAVRELVARLPERQRLALFLRYYCDMSYTEIGSVLEIRTGTVSATLNAAHTSLRAALDGIDCLPVASRETLGAGGEPSVRSSREPNRRSARVSDRAHAGGRGLRVAPSAG